MLVLLSCTVSIPEFFFCVCVRVSRMHIDRCTLYIYIHIVIQLYIYIHICSTHYSYMLVIDGYMGSMLFFEGVKLYVCLVDKVDISLHMYLQYGVVT